MPRILIAEDDHNIFKLVHFGLKHLGHEIIWAQDGGEALAMARTHLPDLILLDVMMPVLDGFQVLATLREERATRMIPVIMLTAHGQAPPASSWAESGAQDYILKPFSFADLVQRLQGLLSDAYVPAPAN